MQTDEQPFDKGELNIFAEDLNLTNIASKHLSSYLASQKSPEDKLVFPGTVSCWGAEKRQMLSFAEVIALCLSEANSAIKRFSTRGAVSPMLDSYFDQCLIHISQRLAVVLALLPYSKILSDFNELGSELLKQFLNLDFRTFSIEGIVLQIQHFLEQLQKT